MRTTFDRALHRVWTYAGLFALCGLASIAFAFYGQISYSLALAWFIGCAVVHGFTAWLEAHPDSYLQGKELRYAAALLACALYFGALAYLLPSEVLVFKLSSIWFAVDTLRAARLLATKRATTKAEPAHS